MLVTYPDKFIIDEGRSLVSSIAEYEIAMVFTQKYLNHSKYGIGAGKAQELEKFVKEISNLKIDKVIVDSHLNATQIFNLEKLMEVSVIDRERLILDIFYSRATTIESKLQIQLAEIEYEMPRVREKAKLLSKSNERAGKGGMGEYSVDVHFRDLKRRMSFIKEKLNDAKLKRSLYQQQRLKKKMPVVSLVGYTSSGKTTLFNLLTNENKETSSQLFTTLSTTTRSLKSIKNNKNERKGEVDLLVIDTVGFISRLPTYMIDAFKATLEESLVADLILLMVDSSEKIENIAIKYKSCWDVLEQLNVDKSKVWIVLSKVDKINFLLMNELINILKIDTNVISVSSKSGYGIRKLRNQIMALQHLRNN